MEKKMINKKALYTAAILASVFSTKVNAAAAADDVAGTSAGEAAASTSAVEAAVVTADKVTIANAVRELLRARTTLVAKSLDDKTWGGLTKLFLSEYEELSDEEVGKLVPAIVAEIKRQLAAR
jgi:hypothetical protein